VKVGIDVRLLGAGYRYSRTGGEDASSSSTIRKDPSGASYAAYAAYRVLPHADLTIETGLRWDAQDHTDDSSLSPRFNVLWRTTPKSQLLFAVGRFQQSQRIHELSVEDGETEFARAEISDQTELSFQRALGRGMSLRIDAYHRSLDRVRPRYENLFEPIELFPETIEDRVRVAPSDSRLRGVEMLVRGDPGRRVFWWVGYALSEAEDTIDGRSVPRSWDQTHAGRFSIGWQRPDRWSVSVAGSVHTGWPTTPAVAEITELPEAGIEVERIPGPRNGERFPSYARLDLQARWALVTRGSRLWWTFDVANLTDRENACCVDDFLLETRPDGSSYFRPLYGSWLGITPSFSILWELERNSRSAPP
jgi:outer membrane receptor protein involved in Fe transport